MGFLGPDVVCLEQLTHDIFVFFVELAVVFCGSWHAFKTIIKFPTFNNPLKHTGDDKSNKSR